MPTHFRLLVAIAVTATALPAQTIRVTDKGSELVLLYGPLTFPANTSHDQMRQPPTLNFKLPSDGWARGIDVDVVDAAGRVLPRGLLHHVTAMTPDKRDLFSPVMMRIGAAGAETGAITMPRLFGLRVRKGDSVFMTVMLHNQTDSAYANAMLRVRVPFTSAKALIGAVSVYPVSISIGPKEKPNVFDLPPGRSEHFWEGSPSIAGRVLALTGHLHRYGVLLRFEDRTEKKVLWEAKPNRDAAGEIMGMPTTTFLMRLGKPLEPSHLYRLTAFYDNPTAEKIPDGGMGVLAGIMTLRGAAWPKVDPKSPEYVNDLMTTLHGEHMHSTKR